MKWTSAPLKAGFLTCALTSALLLVAGSVAAQSSQDDQDSSVGALELPQSITLMGKADPNLRKATAIVNGEVITQTDIDQRLALVILANSGKVSDEERERLRLQVLRNLIDETLQIQEAAAKKITVDPPSWTRISRASPPISNIRRLASPPICARRAPHPPASSARSRARSPGAACSAAKCSRSSTSRTMKSRRRWTG